MRSLVLGLLVVFFMGISISLIPVTAISSDLQTLVQNSLQRDGIAFNPHSFSQQTKLLASDGEADDFFGYSIALEGDTVLVGAYQESISTGSVYVFVRDNSIWTEQAKLTASDGAISDRFGFSVALSGETAVIGSPEDDQDAGRTGSVYVFVRNGTTWTEQEKLIDPDDTVSYNFGFSVAVDGDTALISTSGTGNGAGEVYVFTRNSADWAYQTRLTASDGATSDTFGNVVDLEGDTALIGAYLNNNDNGFDAGSVYVFVGSGALWTEQAKLLAQDGQAFDYFGFSVDLDGDHAVIGAPEDNDNDTSSGSAYIFVRNGTTWAQQAKLLAVDGDLFEEFGHSVALDNDTALVAAWQDNDNGILSGSAYFFRGNGTDWTQEAKLLSSDGAASDLFGQSVALDGDTALIGAYLDDDQGSASGSVYVIYDSLFGSVIANGGFEGKLTGWTLKNGSGDKVKCNKTDPPKEYTPYGECTFIFKPGTGENSKLSQKFDLSGTDLSTGDTLTLSGVYLTKISPNTKIKVIVKYADTSLPAGKITTTINGVSGGWTQFVGDLTLSLAGTPSQLKFQIGNKSTIGKISLDELAVKPGSPAQKLIDLPVPAQ